MDLFNKTSLLFVCLGNICRSPACEGIMKHFAKEKGVENNLIIDSAGIGAWHTGQMPDRRMIKAGKKRGFDFSDLRARQIKPKDLITFDYIIVMDEENYRDVAMICPDKMLMNKVHYAKEYFEAFKGCQIIPDPYYGDEKDFDYALDLAEDVCKTLLNKIALQ